MQAKPGGRCRRRPQEKQRYSDNKNTGGNLRATSRQLVASEHLDYSARLFLS